MKKMLIAGLAALAAAVIIPTAAQASADSCFVRGDGVSCTANTSGDRVSFARVKMGVLTRGSFAILCTKGSHEFADSGELHRGEGFEDIVAGSTGRTARSRRSAAARAEPAFEWYSVRGPHKRTRKPAAGVSPRPAPRTSSRSISWSSSAGAARGPPCPP